MKIILPAAGVAIVSKKRKNFTLTELIVAIIVIFILASLGLPRYRKAVERVKNKGAKSSLGLISAAERTTYYEIGKYKACSNTDDCNDQLRLSLSDEDWDYSVATTSDNFTATAQRQGGVRKWTLTFDGTSETLACSGSTDYCE